MKLGGWLRWLISAALLGLLLGYLVDLGSAARALAGAHWVYFAWLALWITLDRLLMSYKWRLLVVCRGIALGQAEALRAYYVASFAGCFLPSTVGADAMRVAAVSGPERPSAAVAASVVMERTLGFVAAACAALLSLGLLTGLALELPPGVRAWSLAILGVSVLAVVISLSGPLAAWMETLPPRLAHKPGLVSWLGRFLAAYGLYRHHRGTLALFLFLSLLEQSVPVVGTWLAALALEIPLSLGMAAAVAPLALLFTRVPVSVSGFGMVEGLYVAFFSLVGLSNTHSFLLGLVANLSVLVATLPGAWFYARGGLKSPAAAGPADPRP
ncbi:MAG: lysylphosphatidylglycerol synthase transmembrane domain-containing protein [Pseudomonadota bacterium]